MSESPILTDADGGVLTITFNRPDSLNSLNPPLLTALRAALDAAAADDAVRAIVLTGAGRGFSSGAGLKDGGEFDVEQRVIDDFNPTVLAIQKIEKPVIAAVNGVAAGAGASLALASDFRLMAASSKMATLFVRIGLVPDCGASYFLPRLVGVARATEMMMLGEDVLPEQALDWGLIHRVYPDETFAADVRAFAERVAAAPRAAGMVKRQLRKTMVLNLPEQLTLEAKMQGEAARSDDFREGVMAFLEKRKPVFNGR